jgi:hypothetical protein
MRGNGVQHPILTGRDDGRPDAVALWEAQTEHALGVLIRRYLAATPPPGRSQVALDLHGWAHALAADGQARLEELGETHLRLTQAPDPAEPD